MTMKDDIKNFVKWNKKVWNEPAIESKWYDDGRGNSGFRINLFGCVIESHERALPERQLIQVEDDPEEIEYDTD